MTARDGHGLRGSTPRTNHPALAILPMPNITVKVSEEIYRAARITAARMGTSVSALVARFLESGMDFENYDPELLPGMGGDLEDALDPDIAFAHMRASTPLPPKSLCNCATVPQQEMERRLTRLFSIAQAEGLFPGIGQ